MHENDISYVIRGCIFTVYNKLGPGLLESAYTAALKYEITKAGLHCDSEVPLPLIYETIKLDTGYRLDLLINQRVIVEVKSVEEFHEVHHKQLLTYLKLSGLKLAMMVNFNCADISSSIIRKVSNLQPTHQH